MEVEKKDMSMREKVEKKRKKGEKVETKRKKVEKKGDVMRMRGKAEGGKVGKRRKEEN